MTKIRQKGFSLLEVSIAISLMALGVIATMQMRSAQSQLDAARGVAQIYERMNNAVGTYMTLYHDQILKGVQPECGRSAYRVGGYTTASVSQVPSDCGISVEIKTSSGTVFKPVANRLQPTLTELASLGLLSQGSNYDTVLPLRTESELGNTGLTSYQNATEKARNGLGVLIQLTCIGSSSNSGPFTESSQCTTGRYDLVSLVYNLQPFNVPADSFMLYQILEASGGGNMYLSDTRLNGKLRSGAATPDAELNNPLVYNANTVVGAPNVLAMRNGYGSSGHDVFLRRDGSTPLTDNWNVGGKNITGVNTLGAAAVVAGSGGFDSGVFGNFLNTSQAAISAALKASSAFISGALNVGGKATFEGELSVAGTSTFSGDANLQGVTRVEHIRLNQEASLGQVCDSSSETLGRASASSSEYSADGLRLLVCDASNRWVRPQADYKTTIENVSGAVATVSNLANSVAGRKLWVEYVNIEWRPAMYLGLDSQGREIWQSDLWAAGQGGRTWKPTPWKCHPNDLNTSSATTDAIYWFSGTTYKVPYTPPMIFSLDGGADATQSIVFDVGCLNKYESNNNPPHWHVAVGQKERNIAGGNQCQSGLSSNLNNFAYLSNSSDYPRLDDNNRCRRYNLFTPNYNSKEIKARFMVFFRDQ